MLSGGSLKLSFSFISCFERYCPSIFNWCSVSSSRRTSHSWINVSSSGNEPRVNPKMRKTQSWGIYSYNPTKSQLVKSWWTGVFGKEPKIESRCGVVIGILKWKFWWHGNITPKEFNSHMFIIIWHLLGKHHITVTSLGTVSVSKPHIWKIWSMFFRFLAEWKSWITAWDTLKFPWTLGFMILRSRELIADLLRRTSPAFGRGAVCPRCQVLSSARAHLHPKDRTGTGHHLALLAHKAHVHHHCRLTSQSSDGATLSSFGAWGKASCLFNPFSPWGVATGRRSLPWSRRVSSTGTSPVPQMLAIKLSSRPRCHHKIAPQETKRN